VNSFIKSKLSAINQKSSGLASGGAKLLVFRLLALFLSYVFTWYVANYLGSSVLGAYALMNAVVMVGVLISRLGLDQLFLREVSSVKKDNNDYYADTYRQMIGLQFTVGLLVSILLFLGADWLAANWLESSDMKHILRYASIIIIPLTLNLLHAEGFRGRRQLFNYISIVRIWPLILTIASSAIIIGSDSEPDLLFFYLYFGSVITTTLIGFIIWKRSAGVSLVPSFDLSKWKSLLGQSYPMMLVGSMFLIMGWTDTFMLGHFESKESVGFYHVALKVSNVVSLVLFGINGIAAPKISYSWANKLTDQFKSIIVSSASLSFLFSLPLVFIIILFRNELLELFGDGMIAASLALVFLAIGQFINGSCGSVMNILQMTHNQKYSQYILVIAAFINVALNSYFIPKYGIEGAAFSTACSTAFWNLAAVGVVKWRLGVWSVPFVGGLKSVLQLIRDRRS